MGKRKRNLFTQTLFKSFVRNLADPFKHQQQQASKYNECKYYEVISSENRSNFRSHN